MATTKPTDTAGTAAANNPAPGADPGANPQPGLEPIPGSDIVGRGIYIRPRQPYELKPLLFKRGPSGSPMQHYTRAMTGRTYSIPEGCAVNPSPPLPADQSFGQTLIEESWSRFGKQLTLNAGASIKGKAASIDASAFQANSVKSDEDSYYALRSSFVPLWDLYMPNVPDSASDELAALVPAGGFAWKNRSDYAGIFERYGTHFVRNVWVGGKASLVFTVAKAANLKTNEIRAAVQASLGETAKGSASVENKTSLETFHKNSSCKVFGSGGNGIALAKLSEFESGMYNSWLDSVEDFPAVIHLGVVGIWTLIKDQDKAEALKEAYIRETTFVPLTAIVPIGRYFIFLKDSWGFALDYLESPYESQLKTLSKVNSELRAGEKPAAQDKGKGAVDTLKLENITEHFAFLKDLKYADFARPQAALSLAEVSSSGTRRKNLVYFFKNRRCMLIDFNVAALKEVKPLDEFPVDISIVFPGVDFDRIDAVVAIPPNKIYLFSGDEYYRIDICDEAEESWTFKVICKEKIAKGWPGVDFERLDTATYWKNNKVYFFFEDQFIRYDVSNHQADPGYPKYIPSNYVEDWDFFD